MAAEKQEKKGRTSVLYLGDPPENVKEWLRRRSKPGLGVLRYVPCVGREQA